MIPVKIVTVSVWWGKTIIWILEVWFSSEFLLSVHVTCHAPNVVIMRRALILSVVCVFKPLLSATNHIFYCIHCQKVTIFGSNPPWIPHCNHSHLVLNYFIFGYHPFHKHIKPLTNQFTSLFGSYKIVFIWQMPLLFRCIFVVNFPIGRMTIMCVPEN